jgi:hypothetical protein
MSHLHLIFNTFVVSSSSLPEVTSAHNLPAEAVTEDLVVN